jgi:hypothetical protein
MGPIYPSAEEVRILAKYFGISEFSFAIRYLREVYDLPTGVYKIAFKSNSSNINGRGCIFYRNNSCAIYNSPRIEVCNAFPLNHFDLDSKQWEKDFISDGKPFCAGIGIGREWSLDEIRDIKNAYPNVGIKTKTQINPPTKPTIATMNDDSSFLSFSEEDIIQKFRSLPIGKKEEVRRLIDSLYHV